MSNKLKRKPTKTERENSTWASAVKSFWGEIFLNSEYSTHYYSCDEHLTKEGKRKKTILWSWLVIITGIVIGSVPFGYPNTSEAMRRAHYRRGRDDSQAQSAEGKEEKTVMISGVYT